MPLPLPPELITTLQSAAWCHVATLMPDGSPHVTLTWVDTDGTDILINSVATHRKVRNLKRDPRIGLTIVHPDTPSVATSVRGRVVAITTDGAREHIDMLARRYLNLERYPGFGDPNEVRLMLRIAADWIYQPVMR